MSDTARVLDLAAPLRSVELVADPYPAYAQLRREAPVWRVPGTDLFFVSTWPVVTEATARVDDFSNHFRHTLVTDDDGVLGMVVSGDDGALDVFAGADPPDHTAHRRLFFPELVQQRMAALEDEVARIADGLLDEVLAEPSADAAAGLANRLPIQVITELVIGFRDADLEQMQRWVLAGSRFMGGRLTVGDMAAVGADAAGLLPWVAGQLDAAVDRRGAHERSVLAATAAAVHDGVLTRAAAAFTLMVLLGAGGETTTSLIGNAMRILAERPALQDVLRRAPERVPAFVEEVLRFESPFRFHPRLATRPTRLGDVAIPERAVVALLWGSANRDEGLFDQPDEVVLDRTNAPLHLGFGRGIHHCVGAPLARLEARIVLQQLLARTREFALDGDHSPRWADSLWVRRHEELPLVFVRA